MCYDPVTNYGNPGDPWATRFAAAEAATDNICVPAGTYDIGTSLTLTKNWQIGDGARLRPASGATVTFAGTLDAARYRIFDLSAQGAVTFGAGAAEGLLPQWWNDADDTQALQAAVNAAAASGIPVDLGSLSYTVTKTVEIPGNVQLSGGEAGATIATTAHTHYLFKTIAGANRVGIRRLRAAGELGLLQVGASFDAIDITECDFTGVANVITNFFVYCLANAGFTGTSLRVSGNQLRQCTAIYADGLPVTDVFFDDNVVTDGTRFLVRVRSTVDALPGNGPTRVSFCRNRVMGINTGLSESVLGMNVARVLQTSAVKSITMTDNHIERLVTNDTGTVVYWPFGALEFGRNTVVHVESLTTGDRIVSDKSGPYTDTASYAHRCYDNTFDQRTVTLEKSPSAVYHVNALQNFVSEGDVFIGCRCPTHRVWHSVDSDTQRPENITFKDATVLDHRYPAVVELVQFQKNVVVKGFTVHRISNPDGATVVGGDARLRLVNIYNSFSGEVPDLEDVVIRDNTVVEADSGFTFASIYRHLNATGTELRNVVLHGNYSRDGQAVCRFIAGGALGPVTLTQNMLAPARELYEGTPPSVTTVAHNTPSVSARLAWNPTTIAVGGSATTTLAVPGAGARSSDLLRASVSALPAGTQFSAAITAPNTVTLTLTNISGAPVDPPSFTVYAAVTFP